MLKYYERINHKNVVLKEVSEIKVYLDKYDLVTKEPMMDIMDYSFYAWILNYWVLNIAVQKIYLKYPPDFSTKFFDY